MGQAKNSQQLFVIGLPGAGKTTFLAALWHVVESQEVPGALKLVKLRGDASYLNRIRSLWIDTKTLERTKLADETNVLMWLENPGYSSCELWIPDLSGEAFEAQWTDRVAGADYCRFVRESLGGLLFIHPNVRDEHLITDINDIIPKPAEQSVRGAMAPPSEPEDDYAPWDPAVAPTQVQLVDLVQSVLALREPHTVKLAVIVSAWDLVTDSPSPEHWVQQRLPLLHQYLTTQGELLNPKYFGVSAQGGDFSSLDTVTELRLCTKPSDRIRVFDGTDRGHDITFPVRWIMQSEAEGDVK